MRPLGPADAALRAAAPGRSGDRAARDRDAARRPSRTASPCRRICGPLVAAKRPGLFDWGLDGQPYVSDETAALLHHRRRAAQTAAEVRTRALDALAEEAGLLLAEGVVAAPMDIDLCLILGGGWSFASGGITPYLDREGISERVLGRRFLPKGVASLPEALRRALALLDRALGRARVRRGRWPRRRTGRWTAESGRARRAARPDCRAAGTRARCRTPGSGVRTSANRIS